MGLTKSLNEGITRARGRFIARQDADDVALPHRLKAMIEFLRSNPSISAAGSWCERIDERGEVIGNFDPPIDHERICWAMVAYSAIVHPSAVMRRESIVSFGAYADECIYAEDYELWTRWIRLGAQLANVPERLVKYRVWNEQISSKFALPQLNSAIRCGTDYINYLASDNFDTKQISGIRELISPWKMGPNVVFGIPVLFQLLTLRRFRSIRNCPSTRLFLATKLATAVRRSGSLNRRQSLFVLRASISLSRKVMLTRTWWIALIKQILVYRRKMKQQVC